MILLPINTNPDSYSQIIRSLILRDCLGTLGDLSKSFGTAIWLKNIIRRALDYLLVLLGKGTRLKSIILKEYLIIPDYLLGYSVWIYLIIPTTNWESNYLPLGVIYGY
jgi:hypothetical protein